MGRRALGRSRNEINSWPQYEKKHGEITKEEYKKDTSGDHSIKGRRGNARRNVETTLAGNRERQRGQRGGWSWFAVAKRGNNPSAYLKSPCEKEARERRRSPYSVWDLWRGSRPRTKAKSVRLRSKKKSQACESPQSLWADQKRETLKKGEDERSSRLRYVLGRAKQAILLQSRAGKTREPLKKKRSEQNKTRSR